MSKTHSLESYIVGFILSVVCTVIPYFLVVSKSMAGTALLAMILGFAMVQMLIQIVFFLHLGRGPKPLYNVAFFASTVGIITIIIVGSLFIMSHLHYFMTSAEMTKQLAETEGIYQVGGKKTGACQALGAKHRVIISHGTVSPLHTEAHLCDTLTFTNQDSSLRDIAFGAHPGHEVYGGESEFVLRKGANKTITLNDAGTYGFYDHLGPDTAGSFTVRP